jgi:hypothetical protein
MPVAPAHVQGHTMPLLKETMGSMIGMSSARGKEQFMWRAFSDLGGASGQQREVPLVQAALARVLCASKQLSLSMPGLHTHAM